MVIAQDAGAAGVFLISHHLSQRVFYDLLRQSRLDIEDMKMFVGINFLELSNVQASRHFFSFTQALWCDDGGVRSGQNGLAVTVARDVKEINPRAEFFGGVAFKGQPQPSNTAAMLRDTMLAEQSMDVVVTSGPHTGTPPEVEKLRAMRGVMSSTARLGVASGVNAHNIYDFMAAGATDFLVASSIEDALGSLDPKKTRDLIDIAQNYNRR
jgi:predicted TIM-barrel enzyme